MKKSLKLLCLLLISLPLCGCWLTDSDSSTDTPTPTPDPGAISITTNPTSAISLYMYGAGGPDDTTSNPQSFTITATLSGSNISDQTVSASGSEPGVLITSLPSPCTLNTTGGATTCVFTVTGAWNTDNPVGVTTGYTIAISNSGSAVLSNSSISYNLITPAVYLPQTGASETPTTGLAWPSPRFTSTGDGACMVDNLTGLIWLKTLSSTSYTWANASSYIASLNTGSVCGYTDWRLPTVNEMVSLINYGQINSATWLISQGFVNVQSDYWSSTEVATQSGNAWYVQTNGGFVPIGSEGLSKYVWPVRG